MFSTLNVYDNLFCFLVDCCSVYVVFSFNSKSCRLCLTKWTELISFQVIWKKVDNEHVLTFGELVWVSDEDISVDHLQHRDEWNLVISNVQPHHAGLYECQISTKEDLRKYVQLNVKGERNTDLTVIVTWLQTMAYLLKKGQPFLTISIQGCKNKM